MVDLAALAEALTRIPCWCRSWRTDIFHLPALPVRLLVNRSGPGDHLDTRTDLVYASRRIVRRPEITDTEKSPSLNVTAAVTATQ